MTITITIDKDVPMPAARGGRRFYDVAWETMELGDSFVVPSLGRSLKRVHEIAGGLAATRARQDGRRYETRVVVETGERVVRIWRVQ